MSDIDVLESLVLDDDFQELSRILKSRPPNIFRILDITDKEVRWSAFLAWLLDPNENHGLGNKFLRKFLVDIQPDTVCTMSLSNVVVRTEEFFGEEGRGDITIRCCDDKLLCVIENKVWSGERPKQTEDYLKAGQLIENQEDFDKALYVFLTLHGYEPGCREFVPYSYERLIGVLKQTIGEDEMASDRSLSLIKQFIQNVEEILDMGEFKNEIRDRCLKIVLQHKEAVEALVECQPMNEFFRKLHDCFQNSEDICSKFYIGREERLPKNECGLTLSPHAWKSGTENYSHVNYFIFSTQNGAIECSLWALLLEDKPDFDRKELEKRVEDLSKGHPSVKVCHEGITWDRVLAHETMLSILPTDFSSWVRKVDDVKEKFSSFLRTFPVEEIEEVPGVKGP